MAKPRPKRWQPPATTPQDSRLPGPTDDAAPPPVVPTADAVVPTADAGDPAADGGLPPGPQQDLLKKLREKGLWQPEATFLICGDETKAKCASAKAMRAGWKTLKKAVKRRRQETGQPVAAIRTRCFGVCRRGPLVGVQPDGCWYGDCDESAIEAIVEYHCRRSARHDSGSIGTGIWTDEADTKRNASQRDR